MLIPSAWSRQPRPEPGPEARVLGRWQPASLGELTEHRHQLSAALHDGARPPAAAEDAVEALTLVFEELVSNAVRHGRAPVNVQITADAGGWLVDVSDAAVDRLPRLDLGRDPAHGGRGLQLIATLAATHGWDPRGDRKHVWAYVTHQHGSTAPLRRPQKNAAFERNLTWRADSSSPGTPRAVVSAHPLA